MTQSRFSTRDMAYIALMAVLLAVCSWISVPAPVPFTLQTFGVFCALGLLGGRRGSTAVLLYILLGALGLPVFSGFQGGLGKLLGPTGGYILGFLLSALLYWLLERGVQKSPWRTAALLLAGLALCYVFGTAWFVAVYSRGDGHMSWMGALSLCVFPFIVPDLVKLGLALLLIRTLKNRLQL